MCTYSYTIPKSCNKSVFTNTILGKLSTKSNKGAYSLALTMLWIAVIGSFVIDWQFLRGAFAIKNGSPISIVNTLFTGLIAFWYIPGVVAIVLADAILVRLHSTYRYQAYILTGMALPYIVAKQIYHRCSSHIGCYHYRYVCHNVRGMLFKLTVCNAYRGAYNA